MYGMERRRSASQREVGSSGNMGTELAGRTQGQGGKPRPTGNSVLSVCPEELRLMALWAVVRPKTMKTSRRKGFVVSAWRSLCCSDGVSFAPARVCHFLTRGLCNLVKTKIRRGLLVLSACVRISHRKLLGGSIGLISRSSRDWLRWSHACMERSCQQHM